eukprot:3625210-Pleurochrysis_carterae.AAC.1
MVLCKAAYSLRPSRAGMASTCLAMLSLSAAACATPPGAALATGSTVNEYKHSNFLSLALAAGPPGCASTVLVDSRATRHYSCSKDLYTTFRELKEPLFVQIAYGTHVPAVGVGVAALRVKDSNGKDTKLELHDAPSTFLTLAATFLCTFCPTPWRLNPF